MKCQVGWIISWNQDCQQKYKKPQVRKWYYSNGRKQKGTKEPLDESEKGEWKSSLEMQHSKTKIMASSPITSWPIGREKGKQWQIFIFLGSKITADSDCSYEINNLDSILKRRDITLLTKVCISQRYGFSSRHVRMWELNHKEGWVLKNWCFRTVLLEKTIKSLLDCKEIKPVNPKGNQP